MSLTRSIKTCFRKYADFSGRAQRSEFWWFFLFIFVLLVILSFPVPGAILVLGVLLLLGVLLPSIAVTVRRVHDTGRSAWWVIIILLIEVLSAMALGALIFWLAIESDSSGNDGYYGLLAFLIIVGIWALVSGVVVIALLILCALPGTTGTNRYGPDPLLPEPSMGGYRESSHDSAPSDPLSEQDPERSQFCSQCGMQLKRDAQFCAACGAAN